MHVFCISVPNSEYLKLSSLPFVLIIWWNIVGLSCGYGLDSVEIYGQWCRRWLGDGSKMKEGSS